MKKPRFFNRSGMTLIEVILSVALLGIVVTGGYSLISFSRTYWQKSQEEYRLQFATRIALQQTSDVIRYSSAVFTVPKSSFRADNLDAGWDYIGIEETEVSPGVTGNQVVKYTYDAASGTHIKTVLIPARADIVYGFKFTKVNPADEDSLLQFSIETYPVDSLDEYGNPRAALTVVSEVEALNSLQVVDLSTPPYDPAAAVAFRTTDRSQTVVGHVAMVLDTSGSMADNLNGYSGGTSRISILRQKAIALVNNFAQEDNIDIKLVPFATSANRSDNSPFASFYNAKNQTSSLVNAINSLSATGGTNTGDGLRRAYWALEDHSHDVAGDVLVSNYTIILVDGVTTFYSVVSNSNRSFVTSDEDVNEGYLDRNDPYNPNGQIAGNGSSLDSGGTAYVTAIGSNCLARNSFSKCYVIGFSNLSSELRSVNDIGSAVNAGAHVYTANDADALEQVFDEIRQDIVNDLWYLQGPKL